MLCDLGVVQGGNCHEVSHHSSHSPICGLHMDYDLLEGHSFARCLLVESDGKSDLGENGTNRDRLPLVFMAQHGARRWFSLGFAASWPLVDANFGGLFLCLGSFHCWHCPKKHLQKQNMNEEEQTSPT